MTGVIHDEIAREIIHPISREVYHLAGELGVIGEDVELLQGLLIKKVPKSPLHELVVRRLYRQLVPALLEAEAGAEAGVSGFVAKEAPLSTGLSEPEPDLAVIPGDEEDYGESHPSTALLVIEVAVSTQELDKRKASVYAGAGVPEYWVVDVPGATISVYQFPDAEGEGVYQSEVEYSGSATVTSQVLPSFSVTLPDLVKPKAAG